MSRAGEENGIQPSPGKPLARAYFDEGPQEYRGVSYWWLGKYDLTLEIDVKEGSETVMSGEELHAGKKVHLEAGEELRLLVVPQQ